MLKFAEYNIPLKSLPKGTHEYEYHLDGEFFKELENADIRNADLDAHVTVRYDGVSYDLSFVVKGEVTILCDRCLDEMQWPVDATYHLVVKYGDDYRDDADDLIEIPYNQANLNVSYMLNDTATLAIPIKHVHPLGKCNRAMRDLLKKHTPRTGDPDAQLEEDLIDEIDNIDADGGNDLD